MNEDFQVVIMDLNSVKEAVSQNEDGSFTIFINDSLHPQAKYDAYMHALKHINNNDFFREDEVDYIEFERHEK